VERVHSPWRREYVTKLVGQPGCFLCVAWEGQGTSDRLVVHRGTLAFVVMNLYPYNAGHVLVAPARHVGSLGAASPEELSELMALARRLEEVLGAEYRPDGLNLGMNLGRSAGAGLPDHIHLHVVPRWAGDTNFMTTVGETRVIPEDPSEACLRLRKRFEA
jgi:ATP adenylyltransferase